MCFAYDSCNEKSVDSFIIVPLVYAIVGLMFYCSIIVIPAEFVVVFAAPACLSRCEYGHFVRFVLIACRDFSLVGNKRAWVVRVHWELSKSDKQKFNQSRENNHPT